MPVDKFEIFAFYSNPTNLVELVSHGVDGIIVDWERKGKSNRQSLYNTQVNEHTVQDLSFVAKQEPSNLICRVNGPEYWSADEINKAIDLGAKEILVPMVTNLSQAEFVVETVAGRAKIGLMLETNEALSIADQLDKLDIHRFFVGLNDLSIQRKNRNLFVPLVDGTIDELRSKITKRFGIAGLTHPAAGEPIPCSLVIKQMKKFNASFGFLRRAFYKDLERYSTQEILTALRAELDDAQDTEPHKFTPEEINLFNQDLL